MASKKYGYMATIGADTSGLTSALQTMDAEAKKVSAEIREINNNLKFEDGGTVALQQKYELLQQAIEQTRQKLETLRGAEEAVNAAAANGTITEANQRSFQRELDSTANRLARYQSELESVQAAINGVGQSTETAANDISNAADEVNNFSSAVDNAGQNTVTFGDLVKANFLGDLIADGFRKAGSAVGDFIQQGITLASDLTEVQNVVDVTFGDGAAQIYAWSDAAAESFGMSSLAAQQYNGTMGAMLKSMGLTDDKVKEMSMDMVGLAGDMASFYNLDVEKAFEKIRSGISGETEPLKQLGINMSVANLEAYALSQGIETAYKKMTEAEKATLRYNYLMSVTADAQGDFARTSDSFANQQRILELQTQNLAASFGEKLLPKINDLTGTLNENMPSIGENIDSVGDIVVGLFDFVIDKHEAILAVITGIGTAIAAQKAGKVIGDVTGAVKNLFNTVKSGEGVMSALAGSLNTQPWVLAAGAIAAVTVGLIELSKAAAEADRALKENAEESVKAYEEQTEKVEGLEKELDDTNEKIAEIQNKGKLTLTDEAEIGRLQEQNDKLTARLELEKQILETKRQQAAVDVYELATTDDARKTGSAANIESQLAQYEEDSKMLEAANARLTAALESGSETAIKNAEEEVRTWEKNALATKNKILEQTEELNALAENLDRTSDQGNEAAAVIDSLTQKVYSMFDIPAEETIQERIEAEETYAEYKQREGERQLAAEKTQNAEALADYEEKLQNYVDVLDENLALRKIDEDKYYEFLENRLAGNVNKESKLYYKQLERVEAYHKKRSEAADKAAAEEEKAEKARQDAVTKAQKEAETERVNAIKASWDKITRMKDRGEIDEEAEYKLKAQLVKEYCDENEDTWDSYYKWLYDYTKKQEDEIADAKLKAWEDNSKKLADTLEKSYEDIKKQKEQVKKDLQGIDLTETVKGKDGNDVLVLTDLDAEIKKIDEYEASLEKLRKSGISDSLMNAIMEKSYASGDRQAFIDQLLGLSPEKLQLYYDDWERYQAKLEEAADNSVADKLEETNQAAADGVKNIFKSIPSEAYNEGVETARQYLQGIIDSMGGVDAAAALRLGNIAGMAAVQNDPNLKSAEKLIASGKLIPAESIVKFFINDKNFIQTTVGEMFSMGQISGGNVINL